VATRVYTESSGSVGVTPNTWNFAIQINPVTVPGTLAKNTGSAMTSKVEATGTTNPTHRAMGRTIIGPLAAKTITGDIKGQMRGEESNAGANATLAIAVKIVTPAGVDRAVLLAQTASDSATVPFELLTAITNRKFYNVTETTPIPLTSGAAVAGDYLVIEWGFRSATAQSRNITLSYGNNSVTDLPEDTTTTAANNPWWEFSFAVAVFVESDASSDGLAVGNFVGGYVFSGVASSDGVGVVSGVGVTVIAFVASSDGVGAALGTSARVIGSDASSVGSSDALGVSAFVIPSVASSAGTSDVLADGEDIGSGTTIIEADGSSFGVAIVLGDSEPVSVIGSDGSSFGVAVVLGESESVSVISSDGSSSGDSLVSGISAFVLGFDSTSQGVSVVLGISAHVNVSVFSSDGLSSVSGNSSATWSVNGSSSGVGTVSGFLEDAAAPVVVMDSGGVFIVDGKGFGSFDDDQSRPLPKPYPKFKEPQKQVVTFEEDEELLEVASIISSIL
jgi:hypothetical protein